MYSNLLRMANQYLKLAGESIDKVKSNIYRLSEQIVLDRHNHNFGKMLSGLFTLKDVTLSEVPNEDISEYFKDFLTHDDMWRFLEEMKSKIDNDTSDRKDSDKISAYEKEGIDYTISDLENMLSKKALFGDFVGEESDSGEYEIPEEFESD